MENELTVRAEEIARELATTSSQDERNIVKESEETCLEEIKNTDEFKEDATRLFQEKVKTQAEQEAIKIKDKQIQNEYDKYALTKKKELLDKRVKYEKGLIREQVEAETMAQRIINAKKRYGYLYPKRDENGHIMLDENGDVIVDMEKFTPNKMSNRWKELSYNYENLSKSTQKIIKTTLKTILICGGIALGFWLLHEFWGFLKPFITQILTKGV